MKTSPRSLPANKRDPYYSPPSIGIHTVAAMRTSAMQGNLASNFGVVGDVEINDGPFQCPPGYGLYGGQCIPKTRMLGATETTAAKAASQRSTACPPGTKQVGSRCFPVQRKMVASLGDICNPDDPDFNLQACADETLGACEAGMTRDPSTGECVLPQIQTGAAQAACAINGGTWNGTACVGSGGTSGSTGGGTTTGGGKGGGGTGGGGSSAPPVAAISSPGMSASTKKTLMIVGGVVAVATAVGVGSYVITKRKKGAKKLAQPNDQPALSPRSPSRPQLQAFASCAGDACAVHARRAA